MSVVNELERILFERNDLFTKLLQMGLVSEEFSCGNGTLFDTANIHWQHYCDGQPFECVCSPETIEEEGCVCGYADSVWCGFADLGYKLDITNKDEGIYGLNGWMADGESPEPHDHWHESLQTFSGIMRIKIVENGFNHSAFYSIRVGNKSVLCDGNKTAYFPCHNDKIYIIPPAYSDFYNALDVTIELIHESEISKLTTCVDKVEGIPVRTARVQGTCTADKPFAFSAGYYAAGGTVSFVDEDGTEQEVSQLNARIAELENQVSDLGTQIDDKVNEITSLTNTNNSLKCTNTYLQHRVDTLDMENDGLQNTISDLNQQIDDKETEIATKDTQISSLKSSNKTLNATIEELKDDIEVLNAEKGTLNNQISDLNNQIDDKETEISTLESTNASLRSTNSYLAERVDALDAANDQLENQVSDLNQQIDDKETEIATLESANASLSKTNAQLQSSVDTLNAEKLILEGQIEELNEAIELKDGEIKLLSDSNNEFDAANKALQKEIADAEAELANI